MVTLTGRALGRTVIKAVPDIVPAVILSASVTDTSEILVELLLTLIGIDAPLT